MVLSTVVALAMSAGTAGTNPLGHVREVMRTDATGTYVDRYAIGSRLGGAGAYPAGGTILWNYDSRLSFSIAESVSLNHTAAFVYQGLNNERLQAFDSTGDGTPLWELTVSDAPSSVASADNADLSALLQSFGGDVTVRAFTSASSTPLWTYTFADDINGLYGNAACAHWVSVSDDGSIVAAVASDTNAQISRVAILDGATGAELHTGDFGPVSGIDLSNDGARAVLTQNANVVAIDTATMAVLHSFGVSGQGSWHRISGDGTAIAGGGFNYIAKKETSPGVWTTKVTGTISGHWFGAPALSDDAKYVFFGAHEYAASYLNNTYRTFDMDTGAMIATLTTNGTGTFQDSIKVADANADGSLFTVCSWGTQNNDNPEVKVFDRDLNLIGCIDTPGSPYFAEMTPDGSLVVSGGKAVHANVSGNGGDVFVLELESGCPADLDGDGDADGDDFFLFLDLFVAGDDEADLDGDGDRDADDFFAYLDLFALGC